MNMIAQAQANDEWFCTEGSSYRTDNTVYACGIGTAKTEQQARDLAFEAAKREFTRQSQGRTFNIKPQRTTCTYTTHYTCHRMIAFELGSIPMQQMLVPSDADLPTSKIFIGMSKKEMLKVMGKPKSAQIYLGMADYNYEGKRCANNLVCTVSVDQVTGRVVELFNIDYDLVEEL